MSTIPTTSAPRPRAVIAATVPLREAGPVGCGSEVVENRERRGCVDRYAPDAESARAPVRPFGGVGVGESFQPEAVERAFMSWGDYDRDNPFPLFAAVRALGPLHEVTLADGHPAWLVVCHD